MEPIPLRFLLAASLLLQPPLPAWPQTPATPEPSAEVVFWQSVRDSHDPKELEAYLKTYPQGQFAPLATIRLEKLRQTSGQRDAATATETQPAGQKISDADIPAPPQAKPRGWIGLQVQAVTAAHAREVGLAAAAGADVVSVRKFAPAIRSDLRPGDVVISADGTAITDHAHFVRMTAARKPGDTIALVIIRGGKRETREITVGNFFNDHWSAAHRGDIVAMAYLGGEFASGRLVSQDYGQAIHWLRKSADAGYSVAMVELARRYLDGDGVTRNERESLNWYRRAAEAGDVNSIFAIGLFHYRGQGTERNLTEAARWFKRGADKSHAGAMHNYGVLLLDGLGVEKNEALAIDYYRRAAKLEHPEAFFSLGLAYYTGRGVPKDLPQALSWYREAAKRNDASGYSGVGMMYERGEGGIVQDLAVAIRNYRKAAEDGESFALERLKELKATVYDPQEIQKLLSELGFSSGKRGSRPPHDLKRAITAFQESRGLPVNGEPSLRLVGQLRDAIKQKSASAAAAQNDQAPAAPAPDLRGLKDLETLDTPK